MSEVYKALAVAGKNPVDSTEGIAQAVLAATIQAQSAGQKEVVVEFTDSQTTRIGAMPERVGYAILGALSLLGGESTFHHSGHQVTFSVRDEPFTDSEVAELQELIPLLQQDVDAALAA